MYFSIRSIKQANKEAGQHFFDASTMRFFNSRVCRKVIGSYFVTSEQFDATTPRRYTLRRVDDRGWIATIGEFQAFATSRAAYQEAARLWAAECLEIQMDERADAGRWEAYTADLCV
ncbi:DUF7447 family protein [Acidithiobacillus sulfuriphilus]|uniref:DUF7447 family protein n=1 Tax=Acidithiobacillus sulfuriphilus TaxID=1867749 RepID=UPI003F624C44